MKTPKKDPLAPCCEPQSIDHHRDEWWACCVCNQLYSIAGVNALKLKAKKQATRIKFLEAAIAWAKWESGYHVRIPKTVLECIDMLREAKT